MAVRHVCEAIPDSGMSLQSMKYETLETRKDGTKFLSRDMKRAATRLQQLATAYESKQQKLVEEACASSHQPGSRLAGTRIADGTAGYP